MPTPGELESAAGFPGIALCYTWQAGHPGLRSTNFEPEVWVPAAAGPGDGQLIGLEELAGIDVVHGPRRSSPPSYDA
jgi:hypothetical protein